MNYIGLAVMIISLLGIPALIILGLCQRWDN